MAERAVDEGEALIRVGAIPRDEELDAVGVADDRAGRQRDLAHAVDVILRDQILQAVDRAQREHEREHHAEAGEDGARHEIRGEDCRVPAREQRHREVKRDDGVHRKHERRADAGEDQVGHLVVAPVAVGTAPAHREQAVEERTEFISGVEEPVAEHREVGNQADIPEEHRDRAVGRDREHVPLQRRTEVLPDDVRVRDREEIPRIPYATDVEDREDRGADDCENRHGLGGAIDRRAPLLTEQAQDRGDKRAGVADTDPEDEVDDVPRPVDRVGVAPHPDAGDDEVGDAGDREGRDEAGEDEADPPPRGGLALDDPADLLGDPREGTVVLDEDGARQDRRFHLIEDRRGIGGVFVSVSH